MRGVSHFSCPVGVGLTFGERRANQSSFALSSCVCSLLESDDGCRTASRVERFTFESIEVTPPRKKILLELLLGVWTGAAWQLAAQRRSAGPATNDASAFGKGKSDSGTAAGRTVSKGKQRRGSQAREDSGRKLWGKPMVAVWCGKYLYNWSQGGVFAQFFAVPPFLAQSPPTTWFAGRRWDQWRFPQWGSVSLLGAHSQSASELSASKMHLVPLLRLENGD